MSREFGYAKDKDSLLWIGCRAIITNKRFDVPWDRWSTDIKYESGKEDFVWWINNVAIPRLEVGIREGRKKFYFESESGFFACEADNRDSGGYLYIGFYSTKVYEDIIKEV